MYWQVADVRLTAQSAFCMGWTRAVLGTTWTCHASAQAGWTEGGQVQVGTAHLLGLASFLLGRARLNMPKQLIGLATARVCSST